MEKILFVTILPTSRKRLIDIKSADEISLTELFNWSTLPFGVL
jgi:hypothetical protein